MLRQSGQIYHIQLSPNALPLGRDRHTYTSIMNGTQAGQTLPQKKKGGGAAIQRSINASTSLAEFGAT